MGLDSVAKADECETISVNIVKRALEEPVRQIARNAGFEGAVAVGRIRESKDDKFGFNADHCYPEGRHPGMAQCTGQGRCSGYPSGSDATQMSDAAPAS